jgi:tetratricopeptide (TPR) repeat protein
MRTFAAVLLLPLLVPLSPVERLPQDDDERIFIEEPPADFLNRWTEAERRYDARELVDLYAFALDRFPRKLAQPDPKVRRWLPLPRALAERMAARPDDPALESHENAARALFESVPDRDALERAFERFGFTRAARHALESLGNAAFDEGRLPDAVRLWSRALGPRPSPEAVARLARAHAMLGDGAAVARLRARATEGDWDGDVTVGGRALKLSEVIGELPVAAPLLAPAAAPVVGEMLLGQYDLRLSETGYSHTLPPSLGAYGRFEGREYVVLTNGVSAMALDPAQGDSGPLDRGGLLWRYESPRRYIPQAYRTPQPPVGIAIAGGRAFATMYSKDSKQRVTGRRPDRFDGPAALRAFDLASGKLLWDTDEIATEVNEERVTLLEMLPFGSRNYCFSGPPLAIGGRLYALVMTSPNTARECFLVCFDPDDGKPVWCTFVASAPRAMGETATVPTMAEEAGQVIVQTSFGIVASIELKTGRIEWLSRYEVSGGRQDVNLPVFHRSRVHLLPQDRYEMVTFDRWDGREVPLPAFGPDFTWWQAQQFVGATDQAIIVTGSNKSWALRPADAKVVELVQGAAPRAWRGAIDGTRVYIPAGEALNVYDASTWKLTHRFPWPQRDGRAQGGNVKLAGPVCLVLDDVLSVYCSPEALAERFAGRADRPEACVQIGRILERAGRLKEAATHLRRALEFYERDPAWSETADSLRKSLREISRRLGD